MRKGIGWDGAFLCCNRGFAGAVPGIGPSGVTPSATHPASPQLRDLPGFYFLAEVWPRTIAMKRTFQPSKIRRARTHGFLVRMKSRGGRKVINSRRAKGRKRLAV